MQRMILTVKNKDAGDVIDICKPYLHRLVLRRKNTRQVYIEIESSLATQIGIRYEMWKAGIKATIK